MLSSLCPIKSRNDLFQVVILLGASVLAFSIRLFSIARFDTTLQGYEPFFNCRVTDHILNNGVSKWFDWFDERSWHPLGRLIGQTMYPGLTVTAALLHKIINFAFVTSSVQETCVYFGPLVASLTSVSIYFLTNEMTNNFGASLLATLFMATVPGYISTSTAGRFGNDSMVALVIIILLTCWLKSVKNGSIFWSVASAFAYFYAAASWEDYVLFSNLIPVYVLVMILLGRYSSKLYVAYSSHYLIGTLLTMQLPAIGVEAIFTAKLVLPLFTFCYLQFYALCDALKTKLSSQHSKVVNKLISTVFTCTIATFLMALQFGVISPLEEEHRVLLNPTRAKYSMPVLASASENQPASWSAFFFDSHFGMLFFPVGLYLALKETTESTVLLAVYAILSLYFAAVKIRLLVVLAPCVSILSAIVISHYLELFLTAMTEPMVEDVTMTKRQREKIRTQNENFPLKRTISALMAGVIFIYCTYTVRHAVWASSSAYSDPSIVLSATRKNGERFYFDDFRESYAWISQNTPNDAKFLSWWDYGYQIGTMANRTTIVDNYTWNNTQIAQVGQIFAGSEEESYEQIIHLGADYVLVTFGGMVSWAKDDINKFLWMLRIAQTIPGGSQFAEKDFKNADGEFRMDIEGASKWLNSVLYKLSYYRYGSMHIDNGKPDGWDRVRKAEIGNKDFELETMDEVYTSSHWLVRIYKVRKPEEQSISWF